MKKRIVSWSVGIGMSLAALLGSSSNQLHSVATGISESNLNSDHTSAEPNQPKVKSVRAYRVSSTRSTAKSYTGVIEARHESDHAFRVGGKILQRKVEVGDLVNQGDLLATLDPVDYELAVKLAEADVSPATADASNLTKEEVRHIQLAKSNSVSQSELDRVQDGRKAAEARLERAKRALALAVNRHNYCKLRAEANGVVTQTMRDAGEVVNEGTPIIRIAQTDEMEAVIHLPENRAEIVKGSSARATIWGESQSEHEVTLRELSPIADSVTRTFEARFTILVPGSEIRLGRTVTVHFGSTSPSTEFDVPLTAISRNGTTPTVWRIDEGKLVSVPITIERYREDSAVVSLGLHQGDLIVASGVQKLDSNSRVEVWGAKP